MYSYQDSLDIQSFFKIAFPSKVQMDSIFAMYKKYINAGAVTYDVNCACSTGLRAIYAALREWYIENANKFATSHEEVSKSTPKKAKK